jgi:hypothetical protein
MACRTAGDVVACGTAGHGEGCVSGDNLRHHRLDDADDVVQGRHSIFIVCDAEEEWHEDLAQGSDVIILGIAENGRKFCGHVGEDDFLGQHHCCWFFLKHWVQVLR